MASFPIEELGVEEFPPLLREIPDPPPKLYVRGTLPDFENSIWLAVVGSRKYTEYGKRVVNELIEGLAGYPFVIVSGLALGIDALAHKAALRAKLPTLAVPGSGLSKKVLYPASNQRLAAEILMSGGALLSEFEPEFKPARWSFHQRNRIMAGLSHAVFVIEASQKSGTLITSKFASEYNRDVLTVPGSIFSPSSAGPHMLLRLGAVPVRKPEDILEHFNLQKEESLQQSFDLEELSKEERLIFDALKNEPLPKDTLIESTNLPTRSFNIALSSLELKGLTTEHLGKIEIKRK